MNSIAKMFRKARRVGTPIIAINTPDPAATIATMAEVTDETVGILRWDVERGIVPLGEAGAALYDAVRQAGDDADPSMFVGPPGLSALLGLMMQVVPGIKGGSIVFAIQSHRYIDDPGIAQAVWNVRDTFKSHSATLVLLSPGLVLPVELQQDVMILEEPLPTPDQLALIVGEQYEAAALEPPANGEMEASVDALRGLAAFPSEQATAMSLTKDGMDLDSLWDKKRRMISNTKGLSVWKGSETFEDIGGVSNIKGFITKLLKGKGAPKAVAWIDEIEKAMGGVGDTSGVSQDYLGQLLSYMQDNDATGCIFVGPPGCAKSLVAKAASSAVGIPTIRVDMGGMKGSLVGDSEAAMRAALKVISAVSGDRTFFVVTCNNLDSLPPELKSRFTCGTWFFDLPDEEERDAIWKIHLGKYGLVDADRPDDEGWTGREIRQCCDLAWRLETSLEEAATFVVPVAKSAKDIIEGLQTKAVGRFISASYSGAYKRPTSKALAGVGGRKMGGLD